MIGFRISDSCLLLLAASARLRGLFPFSEPPRAPRARRFSEPQRTQRPQRFHRDLFRFSRSALKVLVSVLLVSGFWLLTSGFAHAACSYPDGDAADLLFSGEVRTLQYCDGTNWHAVNNRHGIPMDGLVAHWTLGEGSGSVARDSSGNGNHGTLEGPPEWAAGILGGAVAFDGSNDHVDLGTMDVSGSAMTIAAWVRADALDSCGQRIIAKATGVNEGDHWWMLSTCASAGSFRLRARLKTAGTTHTLVASSGVVPVGTWIHAAMVYDGSTLKLYQDGGAVGSMAKSGALDTSNSVMAAIGRNGGSTDATSHWNGAIDDVRVYGRALSEAEIQALYELGAGGLKSPTARRDSMALDLSGDNKWAGGVLAPNGKIYGIPHNATDILIIDPAAGTATRSAMGATWAYSSGWEDGVLGPDGKIYAIPRNATAILIIDPTAGTASLSAMGADLAGTDKWHGGALGPDGKIYGIPRSATDILIIDPVAGTATRSAMGATLTGTHKWTGGVLGPDGKIYGIPRAATDILIIDPAAGTATRSALGATLTGTEKWDGGVLGADGKIYGIPRNATDILIIDPVAGTATRSAMGATLAGSAKWVRGAAAADGKIYGFPVDAADVLVIDPLAGTAVRSAMGASMTASNKWYGGAADQAGNVYGLPFDWQTTDILIIENFGSCENPDGFEGDMLYNGDFNVLQWCGAGKWHAAGPVPGSGGAGCSSPAGSAGDLLYHGDYKVPQYCDGTYWRAMGRVRDPCEDDPEPGQACLDGTVYAGLSPDGNVKMFTTRCDIGMSWDGASCVGTRWQGPWNNGNGSGHTSVGTNATAGAANTAAIVAADSDSETAGVQPHQAAQNCADLTANGHSDWYLPARSELTVLHGNRDAVGHFSEMEWYWTSTQSGSTHAWVRRDDGEGESRKEWGRYVRCVRK